MPYVGPGSTTTTTTTSPISSPPSFGLVRSLSLPNPHSPSEPSTSTSSPSTTSSSSSSPPTSRESPNTAEEDASSHPTSPGMLSPLGLTALAPPMSFRQLVGSVQQQKQDQPQTSSPQETQYQQPQPQPQQPAGRPGHRRSYSHTHITAPSSYKPSSPDSYTAPSFNFSLSSNSSGNGLGSLPTRRSRLGSGASASHSRSGSDAGPSVSQAGGGAQQQPQHKFHIGGSYRSREGGGQSHSSEEDDSSDEKSPPPPPPSLPPTSRMKGRAEEDDSEVDREERDRMLRLPPLKLRVRTGSAWDEPPVQRRVGTPPLSVPAQAQAATANAVPFPTTKSPSPVGSATVLPLPVLEVVPSTANEVDARTSNTNNNGLRPPLAAPQMRRASSESSGLPTSASLAVAATTSTSTASGPPVIVLTEAPQPQPSSSSSAQAQYQAQAQVTSPPLPSTPTYTQTYPNRPSPSRTASSPVLLLSNGKPLRSSLKSSSSSPNIPFPSQSLVPSMLWPDLHRDRYARYSTTGYEGDSTTTAGGAGAGQGHQRTASAPSTPNIGGSSAPPPSLTSSVSSIASSSSSLGGGLGPAGDSTTSTATSSARTSPASSPPLSPHIMLHHPHPPKNVHFPSQDNNLATVKIFNKSARPAAVSLSRTGSGSGGTPGVDGQRAGADAEERGTGTEGESQTETETEGEAAGPYGGGYGGYGGFGAGLLGRWGRNAWGAVGGSSSSSTRGGGGGYGGFGYGTYGGGGSGGSRSVPAVSSSHSSGTTTGASGYPFPKVHPQALVNGRMQAQVQGADSESEVDSGREGGAIGSKKEKEKGEWYFDLDAAGSSCVPMMGAERGEGNGNVYLESVGFVRGVKDFGSSSSSSDRPARPLTLTGTLLVRNVTYAKTVAVRFTLDEWHTTNDVLATHERSLAGLPGSFFRRSPNGDLRLSETTKVCSPYDIEHGFPPPEGQAPAWDRFRFYINMEDYALSSEMMTEQERLSSNPLEKRTMWLVGRYDAGVDLGVQLDSQANGAGVGGTGAGGEGGLGSHSRSGSIENLPTNLVPGQEWWDNNGGANYKIMFRRVKVPVPATGPRARREGGLQMPGMYRRISAPTTYSPPPVLAPPQISQSISLPISAYANQNLSPEERERQAQRQKEQKEAIAQSTLARLRRLNLRNYSAPGSAPATQPTTPPAPSTVTSVDSSATKGGLPAAASRGGMPMGTPRKDSTSSVDSTPVHTPVVSPTGTSGTLGLSLGHPFNDLKSAAGEGGATPEVIDDDITPRVDGVGRPSWGSSTPASTTEIAVPKSTRMAVPMSTAGEEGAYRSGAMGVGGSMGMGMSPSDVVLGSSPPFSFSSMLGSRPTTEKANEGGYWPWSSFSGSSSTRAAPDKGNSLSNGGVGGEAEKAKASESTTTTNPNVNATTKGPAPLTHTRIPSSSDVAAAFGSPSPRTGMVGLPHRRARKDSGGGALKLAPPPAVAAHARANGNEDRDSDSSSASVSSAGAGGQYPQVQGQSSEQRQASAPTPAPAQKSMNMGAGPALWGLRPASPRPGSPRPGSPRPSASSGTRSPLRVSPVNSSSNLASMGNGGVKSPLGMAMSMGTEMNSPGTPVYDVGPSVPVPVLGSSSAQAQAQETKSGSSTTSDAIYQAFVRQWCFAQAPGPSVGTTAAGASSANARGAPGRGDEAGVGERDFGVIV